jgi:hypothetical protein
MAAIYGAADVAALGAPISRAYPRGLLGRLDSRAGGSVSAAATFSARVGPQFRDPAPHGPKVAAAASPKPHIQIGPL